MNQVSVRKTLEPAKSDAVKATKARALGIGTSFRPDTASRVIPLSDP
jgi:hypothetical protein